MRTEPEQVEVAPVEWINEHTVVVRCEDDILRILKDTAHFRSAGRTNTGHVRPRIPIDIDRPAHARYRRMLGPLFSEEASAMVAGEARMLARELIDRFADAEGCDFATDFAIPWPSLVFLELMGLPVGDLPQLLEFKDLAMRSGGPLGEGAEDQRREAGQQIYAYVEQILDAPASPSGLIHAIRNVKQDGEHFTHEELLDILYNLILAGLDTVTASLECSIAFLALNPGHRRRIVASPELIPNAVEELLRWETPVEFVPRVVNSDTEIRGWTIPAETFLHADIRHANRGDCDVRRPDELRFGHEPVTHYSFGKGIHRCLGAPLARLELRLALEEFHSRIPDYWIPDPDSLEWTSGIRAVDHLPLRFGSA